MASTKELVVERVNENIEYDDNLSFSDITSAIAVYEKTLVTRGSLKMANESLMSLNLTLK
jgi:cytochrome c peroxidase